MSLEAIRNAVAMTAHPKFSQLLALLVDHGGLTVSAATPLLDLPPFMVRRFANRLVHLGYATRAKGKEERYFPTISGHEIDAVMHSARL
jgi:DNA-binding IclR family transcriptional regulator